MKIHPLLFTWTALLLTGPVQAGSMTCGDALITDDQLDGELSEQVLAQCGEPSARDGTTWLYDRSDIGEGTYVLQFSDSGQLQSIEQQMGSD